MPPALPYIISFWLGVTGAPEAAAISSDPSASLFQAPLSQDQLGQVVQAGFSADSAAPAKGLPPY